MKIRMIKFIATVLVLIFSFFTFGCQFSEIKPKNDVEAVISNLEENVYKRHGNKKYYEAYEIYTHFVYLKHTLENEKDLTKEDVIELCNIYKKIRESINYIDHSEPSKFVTDCFPEMPGFYTSMEYKFEELILSYNAFSVPKDILEIQKNSFANLYLCNINVCPLEDVLIIEDNNNIQNSKRYQLFTKDGTIHATVYASQNREGTLYITSREAFIDENAALYAIQHAISIADAEKEIPKTDLSLSHEID